MTGLKVMTVEELSL